MKTNRPGLSLIKKWEGFRSKAYQDSVGVWTIGYGHTSAAGAPVVRPGMTISRAEAERILARDLRQYERAVSEAIGNARVTANQFAAMVSLCYNIGPGAFKRSSLVRHVRNGDMDAAAKAFALYRKAGGKVLEGLVRRRADEAALFRKGGGSRGLGGAIGGGAIVAAERAINGEPWHVVVVLAVVAAIVGFIIWKRKGR